MNQNKKLTLPANAIYMFRTRRTNRLKPGAYFTLGYSPSNALVQLYYAADKKNPEIIQQFVKDSGFTSVKAMCDDMKSGAFKIIELAKIIKKDPMVTMAMITAETFDNPFDFKDSVIRGLLPIEPDEFLDWYEAKLA